MRTNKPELKLLVNRVKSRNQRIEERNRERLRDKQVRKIFQELNLRLIENA